MEKTTIKDLYRDSEKYIGQEVEISGWVRTVRDSKTFGFIELNDGSFLNNCGDNSGMGKRKMTGIPGHFSLYLRTTSRPSDHTDTIL